MDWIRMLLSRCVALLRKQKLDDDLDEELRSHIDFAVEENLKRGMSSQQARTTALRKFGGVTQTKENYRVQRSLSVAESLGRDVHYALRQFLKSPGFAITVVLTLALGIGANTAIFSIVEGVVLAALPYPQPDRLVMVLESGPSLKELGISYPDFQDWQRDARSYEQMSAVTSRTYDLTAPGTSEHLNGMEVSSGFFATLGVK